MRLIDADILKNKLQARHDNGEEDFDKGYNIGIETAMDLIDNAPTVDIKDKIAGAYNEGYMCGNKEASKENEKLSLLYSDMANEIARLKSITGERPRLF